MTLNWKVLEESVTYTISIKTSLFIIRYSSLQHSHINIVESWLRDQVPKTNKWNCVSKQMTQDLVPIPDRQAQIHHFQEDFEGGNS